MTEIAGWLDPQTALAMRNLILKVKPQVCVEIGVFYGKSLINTALALKENGHGVVYGIDPWRTRDAIRAMSPNDNPELWRTLDLDAVHNACMHTIWEHEVEEHVVIIRSTSRMARWLFGKGRESGWIDPNYCIDILYIDGGHSEEASSLDASLYLQKVRSGGYIWLDDADWPSLQKAIGILREQCKLIKDFGHCHLYQKL